MNQNLQDIYNFYTIEDDFRERLFYCLNYFLGSNYSSLRYEYNELETLVKEGASLKQVLSCLGTHNEFKYQFDLFDCVTFVETILALMHLNKSVFVSFDDFKNKFEKSLIEIRYKNSNPSFLNRNHFISTDWLPNNIKYINNINKDLNYEVSIARATINKLGWLKKQLNTFEVKSIENFNLENYSKVKVENIYIKIKSLLEDYDKLLKLTPEFFLAFMVKENWDLQKEIGTCLNFSHVGVCIKEDSKIFFYHATTEDPKQVVKVDFYKYLKFCKTIKTLSGISFYSINT